VRTPFMLAIGSGAFLLLLVGVFLWQSSKHNLAYRITKVIDELHAIEQSSVDNGIELPKADLDRAYTSLRAILEGLDKPAPPVRNPAPKRENR
jgi:hypothetical protein